MARLFSKEYHEHSNSWHFRSLVIPLPKDSLVFTQFLDEKGNAVLRFRAADNAPNPFPVKLEILYNREDRTILAHHCSECQQDVCRHYLTLLHYAYHHLSTDLLDVPIVQTYQTRLLRVNEYWQRIVLNGHIEIADIYNQKTNKIRIFFASYAPMQIRLISILLADGAIKEGDDALIPQAQRQIPAFSQAETHLLKLMHRYKCSYSRKGQFFTLYKHDFIHLFETLKNLSSKVFIKETGDLLRFSPEDFRANFQINRLGEDDFILRLSLIEQISAFFVGETTYVFKSNVVYPVVLPFTADVTAKVLAEGFPLKKADLVYLSSIVARQLGLIKCYLDFDEDIELEEVHHSTPVITFRLFRKDAQLVMQGVLDYDGGNSIPMSFIRFPAELVRFDTEDDSAWYYIPPQIKYQIIRFVKMLPYPDSDELDAKSQLVYTDNEKIETLKKTIFEFAEPQWNIDLSDELKREFVYKVTLKPTIQIRQGGRIDWFEYDIEYNYKDISFTHEELKKFFRTKEKYLKLEDGRLLFFENQDSFEEMEQLLKKSKKLPSEAYKLSIYNLPYVYQLQSVSQGLRVQGDAFLEKLYGDILNRRLTAGVPLPNSLRPIMRSYQKAGFHWLMMLRRYGFSGILADDMGLGKTIQAISVLSALPSDTISMVICPKTLMFNWAEEVRKFSNNISFILYEGIQKERIKMLENLKVNLIIASYTIVQNDIEELQKFDFEYVILDEAQHIKNASTMRAKAVKKLPTHHRMVLSGTPIENNPTELWSIFDFLMPGYLPSRRQFKSKFTGTGEKQREAQQRLKMLISPFILRRRKKDVLIELPDKQEQIIYSTLTPFQEKMYLQVLDNVRQTLSHQDFDENKNYMHILAALTRLRQICNHPALVDATVKDSVELSGKVELLREIIAEAVENGKKMLIFSQFVQMLKVLKTVLTDLGIPHEYMDGQTKNRQKIIGNFNDNSKIRAFLISLKTGGFGLNLTAADTVIIVDPWWNPMGEAQAIDRAHRIGQTKKVMVYKVITQGTIEEKILALQKSKRAMFDNLIEDGQSVVKSMSAADLRNLLEY
ncbi:MAG: DEAD/DEAH box helicase [Candidatus Cloacimonetes bacterium]|nr:DEAD/DEAH box helicase [Candidatus Cloacimonadota bacterium]